MISSSGGYQVYYWKRSKSLWYGKKKEIKFGVFRTLTVEVYVKLKKIVRFEIKYAGCVVLPDYRFLDPAKGPVLTLESTRAEWTTVGIIMWTPDKTETIFTIIKKIPRKSLMSLIFFLQFTPLNLVSLCEKIYLKNCLLAALLSAHEIALVHCKIEYTLICLCMCIFVEYIEELCKVLIILETYIRQHFIRSNWVLSLKKS